MQFSTHLSCGKKNDEQIAWPRIYDRFMIVKNKSTTHNDFNISSIFMLISRRTIKFCRFNWDQTKLASNCCWQYLTRNYSKYLKISFRKVELLFKRPEGLIFAASWRVLAEPNADFACPFPAKNTIYIVLSFFVPAFAHPLPGVLPLSSFLVS